MIRPFYSTFVLFALVVAPLSAGPVNPADPPEGTFVDEWFAVHMGKTRVGHMHSTVHRDGKRITTKVDLALTILRGDARLRIEMDQEIREFLDGTPVGFSHTLNMGTVPIKTVGRIRDGVLTLRDEQFGKKTTREYPFDMSARLAWGIYLEQFKHGFKPGTKYDVKCYDASLWPDAPFITRVEVMGKEDIDLEGRTFRATKVKQAVQLDKPGKPGASQPSGGMGAAALQALGGELTTTAWVDDDGQILRMDTSLGGMFDIRMSRTSKASATAEVDQPIELFLSTFISVTQKVRPTAKSLTFKLQMKDNEPLPDLPNTDMQSFHRINKHAGTLAVRRIDWKKLKGKPIPAAAGGKDDVFLKATLTADCNHPKIRELAAKAAAGAKDAADLAGKLRRFVSEYVTDKNMNVGFATASEVVESREGDCSEHAVFLAAICRAAGLPARGVAGIVMIPGSRNPAQFGYHMWTQVRIDGRWVDIDAALEQTDCDPTHIVLGILDLDDSGLAEAGIRMLPLIGRLSIELEDVPAR